MLPVIAGERSTKIQMLIYTIILLPFTLVPSFLGVTGWAYGGVALLLGLFFVFTAVRVLQDKLDKDKKMLN